MKNLEIKAKINNHNKIKKVMIDFGARPKETMHQIDTYFHVPSGRLKLRELTKDRAYLIYYERGESTAKRWSNYYTYDVKDQKEFIKILDKALGIKVVINKSRILYLYKNARIHLDTVKSLGTFIEIEVEVKKGDTQARNLMNEMLESLCIPKSDFIKDSYSDLLLSKQGKTK